MINPTITRFTYLVQSNLPEDDPRKVTCRNSTGKEYVVHGDAAVECEFQEADMVQITAGAGTKDCLPFAFRAKEKNPNSQPPWISVVVSTKKTYVVKEELESEESLLADSVSDSTVFKTDDNVVHAAIDQAEASFESAAGALLDEASKQEDHG